MILKKLSEILQVLARVFLRVAYYFFLGLAFLSALVLLLATSIYMSARIENENLKEDKPVMQSEDLQIRKKRESLERAQRTEFLVMKGSLVSIITISIVRALSVIGINKKQIWEELIK
ncbi:MAG: hypothetical protein NZL90_02955 [Aquificaceae bacterium]|nr:hypothetical protein [Aquificaceae bacterium]MDW8237221.1 hypothetical protein [Aquificaceae bacterium]